MWDEDEEVGDKDGVDMTRATGNNVGGSQNKKKIGRNS